MKKILLSTDFSENAWNAIAYALALFKDKKCVFYVLNAYQLGTSGLMTKIGRANETRLFQITKEESERGLLKTIKRIKTADSTDGHSYIQLSICDNLTNAIGKTVYEEGIDLIIMGTQGATGLKDVFLGSNTYKIIKRINFCPIIAVPNDFKYNGATETILFVTGYEHLFESYEFTPLIKIATLLNANVLVLYSGDSDTLEPHQKSAKTLIKKHLKSIEHDFAEVKQTASINEAIQQIAANKKQIKMVAMINYWHSFFEKLTHEPVIKRVALNTKVPFLVLHLFE